LRVGDTDAIDTYQEHGRIRSGTLEQIIEDAYQGWRADLDVGLQSILVAENVETVTALNARARTDLINNGTVDAEGVSLQDGNRAGRGDQIITRRNDRRLTTGRAWVKNGDRWQVLNARPDGALTVRRADARRGAVTILPAAYVAEHVDLGYAITTHRGQGTTTDTAHAIVPSTQMTREALYVAMTRGRTANTVYIATDQAGLEEHQQQPPEAVTARSILCTVLGHVGTETSAHETITSEHDTWGSIGQLAAEYDTIAQAAQADRWIALLNACGLTGQQLDNTVQVDSFGILAAELRRAEADGYNLENILPGVINAGGLDAAADIPSLIRYRLQQITTRYTPNANERGSGRLIAGLIPVATGPMAEDMRQALTRRQQTIEQRSTRLLLQAIKQRQPWTKDLGAVPNDDKSRQTWIRHARIIAAYRDRYGLTSSSALGPTPDNDIQSVDRRRAATRLRIIRAVQGENSATSDRPPNRSVEHTPISER
jgi:hypothetical protein